MSATDLTNLYLLKTWLGIAITDTVSDTVFSDLITGISADIRSDISRGIFPVNTYSVNLNGNGKCKLFLPNYPIYAVNSLTINGANIPARPAYPLTGYVINPTYIELVGYYFNKGVQNVSLTYQAGYAVSGEAQTIPASGSYVLSPFSPNGVWGQDLGVSYASGGSLTPITSGSPSVGQYLIATSSSTNVTTYTFNVGDAGKAVLLNYGYIPSAISRAATEWAAFRYSGRQHIGQKSHNTQGDSTTFDDSVMPDSVMLTLEQFKRTFAIR